MSYIPNGDRTPLLYRLPILGRMIRETLEGDEDTPFYALAAVLSLWAIAVITFGYPGLITGALIMTATILLILIRLTRG
ncbi:MAG: hypothetical protein COW55_15930 [Rhodobacteraceae bacterium CG17_big_fil_post_rev_8_21_14_2_50_65_11]|nr:MAG: hypothetical protein COW55_15930 [Rhodobacteraceae bacterium CG17_big_fil_post_rev_8_21_14_2_50_65_11]